MFKWFWTIFSLGAPGFSKTALYTVFEAVNSGSRYWIPGSDCQRDSGLLELNSGFHKQAFPGFHNSYYLKWGDAFLMSSEDLFLFYHKG